MTAHVTPAPVAHTSAPTTHFPDLVTRIGAKENYEAGDFAALIGVIVSVVLLVMICVIAVLMWCLSRHKGDYVTNETDDTDETDETDEKDEKDEDADSGDGESVGSDAELQSKEPLKAKEED